MKMRQAAVFVNEQRAGLLRQEPNRYVFEYDVAYLAAGHLPAVSLTLPKTQRVHLAQQLFPFFRGSWQRAPTTRCKRAGASTRRA